MGYSRGGTAQNVTGSRKKKEGKKKAIEWRRRDKGDLSFWEDLVEVREEDEEMVR